MSRRRPFDEDAKEDAGLGCTDDTLEDEVVDEEEEPAAGGERGDREDELEGAGEPRREMEESLSST